MFYITDNMDKIFTVALTSDIFISLRARMSWYLKMYIILNSFYKNMHFYQLKKLTYLVSGLNKVTTDAKLGTNNL